MMKYKVLFICLAVAVATVQVSAQLSKEEKKEWKKVAKGYVKNLESLKNLVETKRMVESQVGSLSEELDGYKVSIEEKDSRIAELNDQIAQTQDELANAKKSTVASSNNANSIKDFSEGVLFKVQIGSFRNKDLAKYFDNNPNFGGELSDSETQSITIGIFRDYWEADTFKKYMRDMGVKDAWIVPYKDGQRVEIKDVMESIPDQGK